MERRLRLRKSNRARLEKINRKKSQRLKARSQRPTPRPQAPLNTRDTRSVSLATRALHNSNLLRAIYPIHVDRQAAMETFFVNALWKDHKVHQHGHDPYYTVDGKQKFRVCDAEQGNKIRYAPDTVYVRYNTEVGRDNLIPLWLLGFLY